MKDWKRSPEPASMMGSQSSYFDTDPPGDLSCTSTISLAAATTTTTSSSSSIMSIARTSTHLQQIEDVPSSPRSRTKVDTSLSDMAKRVILQKIHMFDTFGDTPFPIIRSILEQIPAKKLRALEEASPELQASTGYIWKRLCLKDFKDIPSESDDWRTVYLSKDMARQDNVEAAAARAKEKYASLKANRIANRVQIVENTDSIIRGKVVRSKTFAGQSSHHNNNNNLTAGQKWLRDARKQGTAKIKLTQGIRKSAPPIQVAKVLPSSPPPSLPPLKKSRVVSSPSQTNRAGLTSPISQSTLPRQIPSNIFITKRRISSGTPSNRHRY